MKSISIKTHNNFLQAIGYFIFALCLYENVIYQSLGFLGVLARLDYTTFANITFYGLFGIACFAYLISYLLNFSMNKKVTIRVSNIILLLFIIIYWVYTNKNYPDSIKNVQYNFNIYKLFLFYIPVMLLSSSNCDWDSFLKQINTPNRIFSIISCFFLFYFLARNGNNEEMTIAYMIATCSIVSLHSYHFNRKNKIDLVFFFVDLFLLVLSGTRGALVMTIAFLIIFCVRQLINSTNKNKMLLGLAIGCLILFLGLLSPLIISNINAYLGEYNIKNRILSGIVSGTFFDSAGRIYIQETLLSSLNKMPFFGYGFLGDSIPFDGAYYAHNLELEFIIDFGWLVGIVLLLLLTLLFIKSLVNPRTRNIALILFCISFIHLQLSLSFLIEGTFWLFLGILISKKRGGLSNEEYSNSHPIVVRWWRRENGGKHVHDVL